MAEYLFNNPIVMLGQSIDETISMSNLKSTNRRVRHPLDGGDQKRYASHGTRSTALPCNSLANPKPILVCASLPRNATSPYNSSKGMILKI
uniref:Uncharacterized protein n=1 Tax=Leersia perrieri TaxID=77586 RepID=A0A0D9XS05_9ORYZ